MDTTNLLRGIAYLVFVKFFTPICFFAQGLVWICKPNWFTMSKKEISESGKKTFRFSGFCLLIVAILKTCLIIFYPHNA
jgi:hypothetical protein